LINLQISWPLRTPAETKTAWYQNLHKDQAVQLAQAGGASPGIQFANLPEPGQPSQSADLAETDEIQLTAANPISSWGAVRKVTFPGMNIDIGHLRNIIWAKDNDPQKWINYNRLREQYMSALEHAVPERFFNDPAQCNSYDNPSPIAGLPDCPQGISAVKAIGLAAAQGQKIYTITQKVYNDNPNIVSTALSAHSYDTQSKVQQALDAGYEVTIHERPITQSGWTGAGFISVDPATGAGAYTIEGGSNGGILGNWAKNGTAWTLIITMLAIFATFIGASGVVALIFILVSILFGFLNYWVFNLQRMEAGCGSDQSWASMISEIFGFVIGTQGIQGAIASFFWGIFSAKKLSESIKYCSQ